MAILDAKFPKEIINSKAWNKWFKKSGYEDLKNETINIEIFELDEITYHIGSEYMFKFMRENPKARHITSKVYKAY